MTIAHIQSNCLRRTLLCVMVLALPIALVLCAAFRAAKEFWASLRWELSGGCRIIRGAIKDCWDGVDVRGGTKL